MNSNFTVELKSGIKSEMYLIKPPATKLSIMNFKSDNAVYADIFHVDLPHADLQIRNNQEWKFERHFNGITFLVMNGDASFDFSVG